MAEAIFCVSVGLLPVSSGIGQLLIQGPLVSIEAWTDFIS